LIEFLHSVLLHATEIDRALFRICWDCRVHEIDPDKLVSSDFHALIVDDSLMRQERAKNRIYVKRALHHSRRGESMSEELFRYVPCSRAAAWEAVGWQILSGPLQLKPPPGLEGSGRAVLMMM
jgi:hypothetical protein